MRGIVVAVSFAAIIVFTQPAAAQGNSETYRQLNLFGDIFERIRADYVDEVSDEQLIESAINSGTHVSEVSVDTHAALSEVSFSSDSDAPTMDVADAVAGVARTLIAGSVLPMRPPPRLSMPGGRIVLGQFLQSVDTRYGLVVRPATVNVA